MMAKIQEWIFKSLI